MYALCRHHRIIGKDPVIPVAQRLPLGAEVVISLGTEIACSAEGISRLGYHPVACLKSFHAFAHFRDHAGELMSGGHRRIHRDRDVTVVDVQVGTADSCHFDLDLDLARACGRFRNISDLHISRRSIILY